MSDVDCLSDELEPISPRYDVPNTEDVHSEAESANDEPSTPKEIDVLDTQEELTELSVEVKEETQDTVSQPTDTRVSICDDEQPTLEMLDHAHAIADKLAGITEPRSEDVGHAGMASSMFNIANTVCSA